MNSLVKSLKVVTLKSSLVFQTVEERGKQSPERI